MRFLVFLLAACIMIACVPLEEPHIEDVTIEPSEIDSMEDNSLETTTSEKNEETEQGENEEIQEVCTPSKEVCDGKDNDCDSTIDNDIMPYAKECNTCSCTNGVWACTKKACASDSNCPEFGLSGALEQIDDQTVKFTRAKTTNIGFITFKKSITFTKNDTLALKIWTDAPFEGDTIRLRTLIGSTFLGMLDLTKYFDGVIPLEPTTIELTLDDFFMGPSLVSNLRFESKKQGPDVYITLEHCPE